MRARHVSTLSSRSLSWLGVVFGANCYSYYMLWILPGAPCGSREIVVRDGPSIYRRNPHSRSQAGTYSGWHPKLWQSLIECSGSSTWSKAEALFEFRPPSYCLTVIPSYRCNFNVNLFPCGSPDFLMGPSPGSGSGDLQGRGQGGLGTCVSCEAVQESGQEIITTADC